MIYDCKVLSTIQCIKYEKLNDKFSTDIFTENMLRGKLGINAIESTKSLYDLVVLDSMGTEKNFAESLEHEDDVVVYTKLPNGFYINTPMGRGTITASSTSRCLLIRHYFMTSLLTPI